MSWVPLNIESTAIFSPSRSFVSPPSPILKHPDVVPAYSVPPMFFTVLSVLRKPNPAGLASGISSSVPIYETVSPVWIQILSFPSNRGVPCPAARGSLTISAALPSDMQILVSDPSSVSAHSLFSMSKNSTAEKLSGPHPGKGENLSADLSYRFIFPPFRAAATWPSSETQHEKSPSS